MRRSDPSVETSENDQIVACPYCGSIATEREHPKGPSLCRSIYFCRECQEPFERFG